MITLKEHFDKYVSKNLIDDVEVGDYLLDIFDSYFDNLLKEYREVGEIRATLYCINVEYSVLVEFVTESSLYKEYIIDILNINTIIYSNTIEALMYNYRDLYVY